MLGLFTLGLFLGAQLVFFAVDCISTLFTCFHFDLKWYRCNCPSVVVVVVVGGVVVVVGGVVVVGVVDVLSSSLVFCHIFRNKLWQKLETKKTMCGELQPKTVFSTIGEFQQCYQFLSAFSWPSLSYDVVSCHAWIIKTTYCVIK